LAGWIVISDEALQGEPTMKPADHQDAATESIPLAWEILDDALQVLVLRCASDVEEHHRYGAEIVWDHLRTLKERLSDAQHEVHPRSKSGATAAALKSESTRIPA
jgi:hypothetical protein